MTLIAGIDEAGYGPNLGPLACTAVVFEVPDRVKVGDLWELVAGSVARLPCPAPDRVIIDDSKKVYTARGGLAALERTVLAAVAVRSPACEGRQPSCADRPPPTSGSLAASQPATFRDLLATLCSAWINDFDSEPWYRGCDLPLPHQATPAEIQLAARLLADGLERAGIALRALFSELVSPSELNGELEAGRSKAAALFATVSRLLDKVWAVAPGVPAHLVIDKHGGRNFYRVLLQERFPDRLVLARRESHDCSRYSLPAHNADAPKVVEFVKNGEQYLPVALASMISKYLRELAMQLFNRFWTERIPGLRPTAGYPTDARRFRREIAQAQRDLGIADDVLWRAR